MEKRYKTQAILCTPAQQEPQMPSQRWLHHSRTGYQSFYQILHLSFQTWQHPLLLQIVKICSPKHAVGAQYYTILIADPATVGGLSVFWYHPPTYVPVEQC